MPVLNRDLEILKHIVKYCNQINDSVERFGDDYEIFKSDTDYRNSCVLCILQIGELANHLSADFKAEHKVIPWREIIGMRNVAAHHYGKMSIETVWGTIKEDIPFIEEYCNNLIQKQA